MWPWLWLGPPIYFYMGKNALNLIGLLAIGYFLLNKGFNFLSSNIFPGTPSGRVKGANFASLTIALTLPLINKTPLPIPVDAFKGKLWFGQHQISDIALQSGVVVDGNSSGNFVFDIQIRYDQLGTQLVNILQAKDFVNALYISGQLVTKDIVIPIPKTKIRML